MKRFISTLILFISLFWVNNLDAQVIEKKPFKEASTIRLYVNDATESEAIDRFTAFINKTSWTVQPTLNTAADADRRVDTLQTDVGSLFDFMMGEFQGQLIFYVERDSSDKMYVAVSGYTSTVTWGGSDRAKMQKGGQDTN